MEYRRELEAIEIGRRRVVDGLAVASIMGETEIIGGSRGDPRTVSVELLAAIRRRVPRA